MSRSLALLGALLVLPAMAYAAPAQHVRGTVTSLQGDTLTVRGADGRDVPVKLAPI